MTILSSILTMLVWLATVLIALSIFIAIWFAGAFLLKLGPDNSHFLIDVIMPGLAAFLAPAITDSFLDVESTAFVRTWRGLGVALAGLGLVLLFVPNVDAYTKFVGAGQCGAVLVGCWFGTRD